jgi:hypothetical protein
MSPDFRSEDADERLWGCASRLSRLIVAGWKKRNGATSGDRPCVHACVRGARGGDGGRNERGRNGLCVWASPSVSWMMDVKMDCSFIILIGWIICARRHNCLLFIAETLWPHWNFTIWFGFSYSISTMAWQNSPSKIKVVQEFARLTLICGIVPHCYRMWPFRN